MITHLRIKNFRSFVDAEVNICPFSLVLGPNGSGKSNLLKFFRRLSGNTVGVGGGMRAVDGDWDRHIGHQRSARAFELRFADGTTLASKKDEVGRLLIEGNIEAIERELPIFNLDPAKISGTESVIANPVVHADGSGTAQVLESLKNGDREDLFDRIEENFRRYVPEVEKLSLVTVKEGQKQIQVRERGLPRPLPAFELSEGTRLILAVLTILFQERTPSVILLEDVDRGMHPRLFEFVVPLIRELAEKHGVNILATSHNPYLVDHFQDQPEAVIIVEKRDGASTLTTLASRLSELQYGQEEAEDMPLGSLWYSGLIGGIPVAARESAQR